MGIFGHMTANQAPRGGAPPTSPAAPGHPAKETETQLAYSGDNITTTTEKDLEDTLEQLSRDIDATLETSPSTGERERKREKDAPHFTLSSSPTRDTLKGPRD